MSRFFPFDHEIAGAACASIVALVSATAAAEAPARPIRVEYDAPAACPDQRAFEAQLHARSSRIVVADGAKTIVRVRIGARGGRFDGDVALLDAGGGETSRHVDGLCPDVVAALSLIAALALDPMASTAADPSATASPAPAAKPAEKEPAIEAKSAADRSSREEESATGSPARDAAETSPATAPGRHPWTWSIGAGIAVVGGVASDPAVSIPAFIDVARWTRSPLAPAFRARFERATIADGASGANFTWTAGSLDVCPLAFSTSALRLWPCARVEAGALEATGEVTPSRNASRPWVSAGALGRARWTILGGLFVEIEGGISAPLVRDRFFLEPDETVHRAPVLAAAGGSSVGASFW